MVTLSESAKKLIANHPRLYHMAEAGSWGSIKAHGLMSTSALLDFYGINGDLRHQIEDCHRPECVSITCKGKAPAVVRDQKPMPEKSLIRALQGTDITPQDWYNFLNQKVFFWGTEERLQILLNSYAAKEHDVLTVDTRSFVEIYEDRIELCHMNSGCVRPYAFARDYSVFKPISRYEEILKKRPKKKAVAEVTVLNRVDNIMNHVIKVERRKASEILSTIYER